MRSSDSMTIVASSASWLTTDSTARSAISAARSNIDRVDSSIAASSSWNTTRVPSVAIGSADLSGDVVLGALVARVGEDRLGLRVLDQAPVALVVVADLDREVGRHVADARGLLHVVGDDHDRV